MSCYKCGKVGHHAFEFNNKEIVCYNCGDVGDISTKCTKPKKESSGKVFALNVEEVEVPNNENSRSNLIKIEGEKTYSISI